MVRLLRRHLCQLQACYPCFQSHNGAIAASGCNFLLHFAPFAFNPTMVRLLQVGPLRDLSRATRLSIPQWCDCCPLSRCGDSASHKSFNPTMVRLLPGATPLTGSGRILLSIPQWCDCCQGKILGFEGKRKGNGEGVAVDLRLPENP